MSRYSDEDMTVFAAQQKCSPESFKRRWIIMSGPAFYVFSGGRYLSPILRSDLDVSLPRDLAGAPIELFAPTANGGSRKKSASELLDDHATVARHIAADMTLEHSFYDERTQTFHEAVCPRRPIAPKFDEQIRRT